GVERREAGTAVGEGADVATRRERTGRGLLHVLLHRPGEVLGDRGEEELAVLRGRDAAVGVDPDDGHLAARRLRGRTGAQPGTAGDREDDVRALLDERLADLLAL